MKELQPDRRELHLTVTSDTAIGFEEMLELALKELRRYTKVAADPGAINHGEISGTVGSYSFEVLRGNPDLCMQIRSLENDGFTRVEMLNPKTYVFEHKDEGRKSISTHDMSITDLPKRTPVRLQVSRANAPSSNHSIKHAIKSHHLRRMNRATVCRGRANRFLCDTPTRPNAW